MATSTNFGWTEPNDTDLVKNGASAMRTLGNAIDSTLYTISGGIAGKNAVINGGFNFWQRGTSLAISNAATTYLADRWAAYRGATGSTVSRQVTNDTTNLPFIQYCARVQRDSGNTSTSGIYYNNIFETVNSIPFAGKQVTLSFYARAGANYSQTSSGLGVVLKTGTGTDQNVYSGFTGAVNVISQTATLTTTWQRFTYNATLGSTITQIAAGFEFTPVGTAGAADYFEITGVQLELGSSATPFSRAGGTIQGELAACQRYYWRSVSDGAYSVPAPSGFTDTTTNVILFAPLPVQMRVSPTSIEWNSLQYFDSSNVGSTPSSITISTPRTTNTILSLNATVVGATAGRFAYLRGNNTTAAYLAASAEL